MYPKILVPLDGSKRAEAILPHVEMLAQHIDSIVILLHVIEPIHILTESPPSDLVEDILHKDLLHEAKDYLRRLEWRLRTRGVRVKCLIEEGSPVRAIIEIAERERADLIAIASHGQSGLSRFFYGSVTAGVIQRIDRPLLLIRTEDEAK